MLACASIARKRRRIPIKEIPVARNEGDSGEGDVRLFVLIALLSAFVDQSTKAAAMVYLVPSSPVTFLGDYFRFTLIHNRGAAFGVTLGPFSDTILAIISALAILFIILYYLRTPPESIWQHLSFGMITGGAAGNLIDRIAQGEVVDFMDLGIGQVRWPIFNVADIAVTVGAILLLSHSFSSGDGTAD